MPNTKLCREFPGAEVRVVIILTFISASVEFANKFRRRVSIFGLWCHIKMSFYHISYVFQDNGRTLRNRFRSIYCRLLTVFSRRLRIIDSTFLAEIVSITSFRRILMNLMGLITTILSTRQTIPGCQKTASRIPRAAEGVIISYDTLSTFISGLVKRAYGPQTSSCTVIELPSTSLS